MSALLMEANAENQGHGSSTSSFLYGGICSAEAHLLKQPGRGRPGHRTLAGAALAEWRAEAPQISSAKIVAIPWKHPERICRQCNVVTGHEYPVGKRVPPHMGSFGSCSIAEYHHHPLAPCLLPIMLTRHVQKAGFRRSSLQQSTVVLIGGTCKQALQSNLSRDKHQRPEQCTTPSEDRDSIAQDAKQPDANAAWKIELCAESHAGISVSEP